MTLPIAGRDPPIAPCSEGHANLVKFRLRRNHSLMRRQHGSGAIDAHRSALIIHKDVRRIPQCHDSLHQQMRPLLAGQIDGEFDLHRLKHVRATLLDSPESLPIIIVGIISAHVI
jgi:hypothetical protein